MLGAHPEKLEVNIAVIFFLNILVCKTVLKGVAKKPPFSNFVT
jgi:hypothetical protein